MFNLDGEQVFVTAKIIHGLVIVKISLYKFVHQVAAGGIFIGVEYGYRYIEVNTFLYKHTAQLASAQYTQPEMVLIKKRHGQR